MTTSMNQPRIVIDEVGLRFRARIVKVVPSRSALCISPEAFLEGKQLDLFVLPGLYADRKTAIADAQNILDQNFSNFTIRQ